MPKHELCTYAYLDKPDCPKLVKLHGNIVHSVVTCITNNISSLLVRDRPVQLLRINNRKSIGVSSD